MSATTISCEFCKKECTEKTIVMHISKRDECKLHYGSRFLEMKKKEAAKKKREKKRKKLGK